MSDRKQIADHEIDDAVRDTLSHLRSVIQQKGHGSFASTHEAMGVILCDEGLELQQAVQKKRGLPAVRHELLDIAAACIFAVACIDADGMDW